MGGHIFSYYLSLYLKTCKRALLLGLSKDNSGIFDTYSQDQKDRWVFCHFNYIRNRWIRFSMLLIHIYFYRI